MAISGTSLAQLYEYQRVDGMEDWVEIADLTNVMDTGRGFFTITLSSDGKVVALGAPNNDKLGQNSGEVVTYVENLQAGPDEERWIQLGSNINGQEFDLFGNSIALSEDGYKMIVGAPGEDTKGGGYAKIYGYQEPTKSWSLLHLIPGEPGDDFGNAVSMDGFGKNAIIGAPKYKNGKGIVRIMDIETFSTIQPELGTTENEFFGHSVSMSLNGKRVCVGAWAGNYVRAFSYDGIAWSQLYVDITSNFEAFGYSVSMNEEGTLISVGAPYDSEYGPLSGCVKVYKDGGTVWKQLGNGDVGESIQGTEINDLCGAYISLSDNGSLLIAGCPGRNANAGLVAAFKVDEFFQDPLPKITEEPSIMPSESPLVLQDSSPPSISLVPSMSPTMKPSVSSMPTQSPSFTAAPTVSSRPSTVPTISHAPSTPAPTISTQPSDHPSVSPSVSQLPTQSPSEELNDESPITENDLEDDIVQSGVQDVYFLGSVVGVLAVSGAVIGTLAVSTVGGLFTGFGLGGFGVGYDLIEGVGWGIAGGLAEGVGAFWDRSFGLGGWIGHIWSLFGYWHHDGYAQ